MDYLHFLWLTVWWWTVEGRRTTPAPGTCTYSKVYSMFGADCSAINLVSIPHTLNTKIEILDASVNRIRMLKNSSFTRLGYLRFLYLNDNPISFIEAGAFEPLEELEVLDLSLNAIRSLPELLPVTLRKLYLSENPLMHLPLTRAWNLQFLELASCYLETLPEQLGQLPSLRELNLTGNPLVGLNVSQLASFCHLRTLALPSTLTRPPYSSSCQCARVLRWTTDHNIRVSPSTFNCTSDLSDCGNSTEEVEVFASCVEAYERRSAHTSQYLVVGGASLALLLCVALLTFLWTRRKKPPVHHQQPPPDNRHAKLLPDPKPSRF